MNAPFRIDPEFQSQIPPLRPEEREQLETSLRAEGCRDALVVWAEQGILLDGHTRYAICTEYNIPFQTVTLSRPAREAAADWIDANQLGQRNLTDQQYALLRGRRSNRMKKNEGAPSGNRNAEKQRRQNDDVVSKGRTCEKLARQYGVSPKTIERDGQFASAVDVLKAVDPEIEAKVIKGNAPARAKIVEAAKAITRNHDPKLAEEILNGNGAKSPATRKGAEVEGRTHPETNGDGHAAGPAEMNPEAHGTPNPAPRSRMSARTRAAIELLADGTYRSYGKALEFLNANQIDLTTSQLHSLINNIIRGNIKLEDRVVEKKDVNGSTRFRIRKIDPDSLNPVSRLRIRDFLDAVTPLLNQAIIQTDKSEYMVSPNAILFRLRSMERLFNDLREELKAK